MASQHRKLFEVWEATKDVKQACLVARMSQAAMLLWTNLPNTAPNKQLGFYLILNRWSSTIQKAQPTQGKRRIADEVAKAKKLSPQCRTAEGPGQTIHVELCFVPATHLPEVKLPAVSGSSGRLVIESAKRAGSEAEYPGQVFADRTLDYAEAMKQFVAQSAGESTASASKGTDVAPCNGIEKRQLLEEEATLRTARRQVRQRRKQEDAAWQTLKGGHKAQQQQREADIAAGNRPPWGSQRAATQKWKQLRKQRHSQLEQRKVENQHCT